MPSFFPQKRKVKIDHPLSIAIDKNRQIIEKDSFYSNKEGEMLEHNGYLFEKDKIPKSTLNSNYSIYYRCHEAKCGMRIIRRSTGEIKESGTKFHSHPVDLQALAKRKRDRVITKTSEEHTFDDPIDILTAFAQVYPQEMNDYKESALKM